MNGSTLSYVEALKLAVKNDIAERNNIDMEIKMSLSDLGIELISCYSALPNLVAEYKSASPKPLERTIKSKYCMICGKPLIPGKKFCMECGTEIVNN